MPPPPVLFPYATYKRTSQFSNQVLQLSYQTNGDAPRPQFSRVINMLRVHDLPKTVLYFIKHRDSHINLISYMMLPIH